MATKLYLPSSGSPPVTPSTWNHPYTVATTYIYEAVRTKISSAFATITSNTGTTSGRRFGVLRYVIGPLTATQISGTVKLVMRVRESNAGANANLSLAVKIIKPDGTDRSVLLAADSSDSASAPYELTTTLSVKYAYTNAEAYPMTLTAQTPTAGDYLVIEIGFREATTVDRTIDHRIGDNSANDCPETVGDTNDYCPWVEFSQTLPLVTYKTLTGTSAGSAATTPPAGLLRRIRELVSVPVVCTATATAGILVKKSVALAGVVSAISAVPNVATIKRLREIISTLIQASASAGADLHKIKSLTGSATAVSSASAGIRRIRRISGISQAISTGDGSLTISQVGYKTLTGTASGQCVISGWSY